MAVTRTPNVIMIVAKTLLHNIDHNAHTQAHSQATQSIFINYFSVQQSAFVASILARPSSHKSDKKK